MGAALWALAPWLASMAALAGLSCFFSGSEAALFFLSAADRAAFRQGGRLERLAARLLDDPDRLLSTVLLCNLTVNMLYFTLASAASLELERRPETPPGVSVGFALGALLALIVFSEMLPKVLAVIRPRVAARLVALPMALAVRGVRPALPVLRTAVLLSQRLIWPGFKPEPHLEVADLERAIELSTTNAQLLEQEQQVLRNIVLLADVRVEEWMRPRTQFRAYRPPVNLADLQGGLPEAGFLLVTEPDSEEVAAAVQLRDLWDVPDARLDRFAQPVVYAPWCATMADALQQMLTTGRQVTAVVNEFGETIGVLTFDDLLDGIFGDTAWVRLAPRADDPLRPAGEDVWLAAGGLSLRLLARRLDLELPSSKSVTLGGVVQETLGRLAAPGDRCAWGPLACRVVEAPRRGRMLVELRLREAEEARGA